jgi:aminopeptidase N
MDLQDWSNEWLYTAGFDTFAVETRCEGATLRSLVLSQSAPAAQPYLRTHMVDVALYNAGQDGLLVAESILAVRVSGARTAVAIGAGLPCPVLVNPNHGDWAYAKVRLRDAEAEVLGQQLKNVPDPLDRSMFLAALFDRAKAGDMPIAEYLDRAIDLAASERNLRVIQQISASVVESVDLLQRMRPEADASLARLVPRIEELSLRQANAAGSQDLKRIWLNAWLGTASSPAALATARDLLEGRAEIDGIAMSSDIRWRLLTVLSRHGEAGIDALLAAESTRDPSDSGLKSLLTARAAKPVAQEKAILLGELQDPRTITGLARQRAVMAGLFPANQTALQLALLERILGALPEMSGKADPYFLSSYAGALLTPMCREESTALMRGALDAYGARLDSTASRFLREALQADSECLLLRGRQQVDAARASRQAL